MDDAGRRLREQMASGTIVQAPGVYDCVSARVIEQAGFQAAYVTGHGISNATIGESDLGLMSFREVADRVRDIATSIDIGVIADADDGYGGPLNVQRTVREMERGGAAAVQIEDQQWPKRCGHFRDKRLIETEAMAGKIRAAADAKTTDLVIIARTDALAVHGFDAAVERCNAYFEAGADVAFIDALGDRDEVERAVAAVNGPMLANMVEGSQTAYLPAEELQKIGFAIVIWPLSLLLTSITAMQHAATTLRNTGRLDAELAQQTIMDFEGFRKFWDVEATRAVEDRYTSG